MTELDRVFAAASAVCQEATRRWFGDPPDGRFDVPLAMLLDLDEALGADLPDAEGAEGNDPRGAAEGVSGRLAHAEGAS